MHALSREILQNWQVRKKKAQKTAFIEMMQKSIPGLRVEEGGLPRCRNLVLGDVDTAKLVFTAHYDTCARLPFPNFITPRNVFLYLFYNLLIVLPFVLLMFALGWLFLAKLAFPGGMALAPVIAFGLMLYVFLGGPPNPNTANDNTSGVVTLVELIHTLSEEQKAQVAFVFFDHEESGLLGSSVFASKHRKSMKDKLLLNFDCVSDGDHLLFVLGRRAWKRYAEDFRTAFPDAGAKTALVERSSRAFYPSDQVNFPVSAAVAALQKKPFFGLYMGRIHTARDTVFEEENIRYLCEGTQKLIEKITASL